MKTGIHTLTMAEYLALDALSSGVCATILSESPYHAKWSQEHSRDASSEMDIGTFAHAMLLEGGTDALVVIEADDWRTKAAKEARDAARADGLLPILAHKLDAVKAMVKSAREYIATSELSGIFDNGAAEQSMVWTESCDDGEILCKARADWLTEDGRICLSYKTTTGTANPESWIRTQLPSYDVSTVFYERAVLAVRHDIEETRCIHLVQEQLAPYACSLVALAPAFSELAERKLERAINMWAQCMASGKWPAYPTRICYAEPKAWQVEEVEIGEFTKDELAGGLPL